MERNIIRCNPSFHHRERYESIAVDAGDGNIVFGRLLALFAIAPPQFKTTAMGTPVALWAPYDIPIDAGQRKKDLDLGLYRVRHPKKVAPEMISAKSIIRGALLLPAHDKSEDYLVFDVLDADMYMRMQEQIARVS